MKNYLFICFIILSFACSSSKVISQDNIPNKAKTAYEKGSEEMAFGKYDVAIAYFEEALELAPNYINANLQLANILQNYSKDYARAAGIYDLVIEIDPSLVKAHYNAAVCYLNIGNYDRAADHIDKFLTGDLSAQGKFLGNSIKNNISFSREAIKNPVAFQPVNLGPAINSAYAEYFPAITADNEYLYFTLRDESSRYPQEDIYAAKQENGVWLAREKLSSSINSDFNEGAHSIAPSGKYLLFTSNNHENGNNGSTDIYIAKKVGDTWKNAVNLGKVINSRNWESQPVLSADASALYFVSANRADGLGESDIYVSYLEADGKFGAPVNLGNVINTPGDEQRPFIHPDGKTLYFASTGHPGMGNGDIFMSKLNELGEWTKPVNLGYPINTIGEELGIYVSTDGKTAYISSEREGGYGQSDIYKFDLPETAQPEKVVYVKGKVFDAVTLKPIKCPIKIYDVQTGELFTTLSTDEVNGSFLVTLPADKDYAYEAIQEGYLPFSENFSLESMLTGSSFELEAPMQAIEAGKEFVLKNVFFATNSFTLEPSSKSELLRLDRKSVV